MPKPLSLSFPHPEIPACKQRQGSFLLPNSSWLRGPPGLALAPPGPPGQLSQKKAISIQQAINKYLDICVDPLTAKLPTAPADGDISPGHPIAQSKLLTHAVSLGSGYQTEAAVSGKIYTILSLPLDKTRDHHLSSTHTLPRAAAFSYTATTGWPS